MNKSEQFTSVPSNNFGPTSQMTALGIFYGVLVLLVGYPQPLYRYGGFVSLELAYCYLRTCQMLKLERHFSHDWLSFS